MDFEEAAAEDFIESSLPPENVTRSSDLFLDTNGSCFFCLKPLIASSSSNSNYCGDTNEGGMKEISLRNICRYLDINSCSILLKTLGESVLNAKESQRTKCDFSVSVCLSCSSIAETLSKLLRHLEMTEMRINHQLQMLEKILVTSRKPQSTSKEYSERIDSVQHASGDSLDARLVKHLRHEATKKCSSKVQHILKTGFPRVQLHRLPTSSLPPPKEKHCSNEHSTSQSRAPFKKPTEPFSTVTHSNNPANEQFVLETIAQLCKEVTSSPKKMYNCIPCNTPKELLPENIIDKHLVNVHPERFFSHMIKALKMSEDAFQICCREALAIEVTNSRKWMMKQPEFSGEKSPVVVCQFCRTRFFNAYYFKHHITLKHFSLVEYKIKTQFRNFAIKKKRIHERETTDQVKPVNNEPSTSNAKLEASATQSSSSIPSASTPSGDVAIRIQQSFNDIVTKLTLPTSITFYATTEEFVLATLARLCKEEETKKDWFHCLVCVCGLNELHSKHAIDKHLITIHPDKFFSNIRPQNLSENSFQMCCREVLTLEYSESRQWTKQFAQLMNVKSPAVICSHCNLRCTNAYWFKPHMVLKHYSIVEQKITEQLEKYALEDTLGKNKGPDTRNTGFMPTSNVLIVPQIEHLNEWTCYNCDESFESEMEMLNHNRLVCPIERDPLDTDNYGESSPFREQNSLEHMEQSCGVFARGTPVFEEEEDSQNYNDVMTYSSELCETNYDMEVECNDEIIDVKVEF